MAHTATVPRTRNRCDECGGPARDDYRVCWRCHFQAERAAAFDLGRAEGLSLGKALGEQSTLERLHREGLLRGSPTRASGLIRIDAAMWRRLALLAHPDRHGGSPASLAAMSWLNAVRGQVSP